MPTDIGASQPRVHSAKKYVVWATTTAFGLFGLLRLPWVETQLILPLTRLQGDLAAAAFQTPAAPISVTLACSGTEVIAMCLGAILAYPVSWRLRLSGAALIVLGILGLNTVRIGTLGLASGDPQWFNALHLYLWPAGLILATSGAVFVWMRHADESAAGTWAPSWRFVALALVLLALSALAAPSYIDSAAVYGVGRLIAHAGAMTLAVFGGEASATGNVLWTARGGFSVTGDCVATPLLPLYVAAVWTYAADWRRRLLGTAMAVPIFFVLGVVRLLLVALPQSIAPSPEFASHAFYQVVLAGVAITLAGRWRHGPRKAAGPVAAAMVAAVLFLAVAGDTYARTVMLPVAGPLIDPQAALAFLPPFQIAVYLALWLAAGRGCARLPLALGLALLIITHLLGAWWLTMHEVPELLANRVALVRAWALAGPLLLCFALMRGLNPFTRTSKTVRNSTVSPAPPQ